ncbi:hypothetical protein GCM10022631_24710 [Deinococcus rubellus]|uniref:hypothetical protein n=1 Tax=Deinococcus rubellus TaxID=1889240 RepID=UPI0031EF7756
MPRLTTLSVERAVFDPATKRRATLNKVHVHGTAMHIPGPLRLMLTAVRLEAKALKKGGWVLLSNLQFSEDDVATRAGRKARLVKAYRQRWAIEDVLNWSKGVLKWESVRLMRLDGLRVLVGCAWIVAAFMLELGATLDEHHFRLVAHLGAGEHRNSAQVLSDDQRSISSMDTTPLLRCPDGITLVFLPPYWPELQSAERLWQRTDAPLENRHFETLTQLQKTLAAQCCWLEKQQNRFRALTGLHRWPKITN